MMKNLQVETDGMSPKVSGVSDSVNITTQGLRKRVVGPSDAILVDNIHETGVLLKISWQNTF